MGTISLGGLAVLLVVCVTVCSGRYLPEGTDNFEPPVNPYAIKNSEGLQISETEDAKAKDIGTVDEAKTIGDSMGKQRNFLTEFGNTLGTNNESEDGPEILKKSFSKKFTKQYKEKKKIAKYIKKKLKNKLLKKLVDEALNEIKNRRKGEQITDQEQINTNDDNNDDENPSD